MLSCFIAYKEKKQQFKLMQKLYTRGHAVSKSLFVNMSNRFNTLYRRHLSLDRKKVEIQLTSRLLISSVEILNKKFDIPIAILVLVIKSFRINFCAAFEIHFHKSCLIIELEDSRTRTYLVVGSLTTVKLTLPGLAILSLLRKSSCEVITS